MTREEAIKWLNRIEDKYIHDGDDDFDAKRKQAIAIAIEALEESPRPIDQIIKIDLESGVVPISACEPKGPKTIVYVDRPKGEWIKKTFGYGECSECGCIVGNRFTSNFCPNCGSDNQERSE